MERDLKLRSKAFAHSCVKLAFSLPEKNPLSAHTQKQLIRASTSVAANYRASLLGQSKRSFISKLSIVIGEADECAFWIEFLLDEKLLSHEVCGSILKEAKELTAIFIASRKTAEKTLDRGNKEE